MGFRRTARVIFGLTLLTALTVLVGCPQPQLGPKEEPGKAAAGKGAGKAAPPPVPVGPARLEGSWQGVLAEKLRLVISVSKSNDGSYAGVIDSVDQGVSFPIDSITFDPNRATVRFSVSKVGGIYEGTFSNDRAQIVGGWTQNGSTAKLIFSRK